MESPERFLEIHVAGRQYQLSLEALTHKYAAWIDATYPRGDYGTARKVFRAMSDETKIATLRAKFTWQELRPERTWYPSAEWAWQHNPVHIIQIKGETTE